MDEVIQYELSLGGMNVSIFVQQRQTKLTSSSGAGLSSVALGEFEGPALFDMM